MTRAATIFALVLLGSTLAAQRPSDPALLVPETAPPLDYVPVANPVTLPAGTTMGATATIDTLTASPSRVMPTLPRL